MRRRPGGEPCIFYVARRSELPRRVCVAGAGGVVASRRLSLEALASRQHVAGGPGHVARRLITHGLMAVRALPTRLFGFGLEQAPGPALHRTKWAFGGFHNKFTYFPLFLK
jgi:hypothetical protein